MLLYRLYLGGGRKNQELLVPQKSLHKLIVGWWEGTKLGLLGGVVKPLGQLLKFAHGYQLTQMPIHRIAQASEILPSIDVAGFQLIRKVRSGAS